VAFSYEPASTADRDRLRIALADVQTAGGIFKDEELDRFLADGGSLDEAVKLAIRSLMVQAAVRGDPTRVAALKLALDAYGGNTLPTVSVTFPGNLPMDAGYEEGS